MEKEVILETDKGEIKIYSNDELEFNLTDEKFYYVSLKNRPLTFRCTNHELNKLSELKQPKDPNELIWEENVNKNNLLPEKKTKKERIEELEKRVEQLEKAIEIGIKELSKLTDPKFNRFSVTEGISNNFKVEIEKKAL